MVKIGLMAWGTSYHQAINRIQVYFQYAILGEDFCVSFVYLCLGIIILVNVSTGFLQMLWCLAAPDHQQIQC